MADAKVARRVDRPGQQKVDGRGHGRSTASRSEKLVRVEKEPLWLQGFEGKTANESIGSLVAKVDGRNVPLTVGYHKVTVDIRDQIARTVIEESFVNHTDGRLEGVFHFPLPQDASISGFGMWIGDELVEADVVEKQRAREIYETILRERRDPGLLEWTGGNIFKARVFPIFAALARSGSRSPTPRCCRCAASATATATPCRASCSSSTRCGELAIDVKVNSAMPLQSVSSPDAHRARSTDRALGPRRVHRPGIHARRGISRWWSRSTAGSRTWC